MPVDYIHGYSFEERDRLIRQASVLAPHVFSGLDFTDASRILEIGCAVGAELRILADGWPASHVAGLDRNERHLAAARSHLNDLLETGRVTLLSGDAHRLPIPSATYDRVMTIWTLEHVSNPREVIVEALRVLRENGVLIATEVDNATFGFAPGCEAIAEWWRRFNVFQRQAGGDPFVGQRLDGLARDAGGREVESKEIPIINSTLEPHRRQLLIDYMEELLLSGSKSLCHAGYADAELVNALKDDFERVRMDDEISFQYHAVRMTCKP